MMKMTPQRNNREWNRWVLNVYWLMSGMIVLSGLIVYGIKIGSSTESIPLPHNLLITASAYTGTLLLAEIVYRSLNRYVDYMLILVGLVIACVIMLVYGNVVDGLYVALDIPIIVSLLYFDRTRLRFAVMMASIGFIAGYVAYEPLRLQIQVYDLYAIFGMIAGTSLIGFLVLRRGRELIASMERAVRSEMVAFADSVAVENASKYDHQTRLVNHITFHEYMTSMLVQCERYELPLSLAVLDLDNFKSINDTFGHQEGDTVLREAARVIQESISPEDVAARYGGEEFALILTGKGLEQSSELLESIRRKVSQLDIASIDHRQVTLSIGVAVYEKGMTKEELFHAADSLMYAAKHGGKNRVAFAGNGGGVR
jgi:diguanylate cyclase